MSPPQDPPYPFPPPLSIPESGELESDGEHPLKEAPPSLTTHDPRVDPQRGDELIGRGQIRRVIRREGDNLWCQDGAIRYKTTVQRWQEWCRRNSE
jgi:hypothetical protein